MTDHEHEPAPRDPRSMLAELDYWRPMLEDLSEANDQVRAAADAIVNASTALLPLIFAGRYHGLHETASSELGTALEAVRVIGERLGAMIELAGGRAVMLDREREAIE